jgi:hypothetical protein
MTFSHILLAENAVYGYLSLLLPLLEKTRSVSGPPPGLEGEVGEVGDRGDRDPPPQDDRRAGGRPGDRPTTQGGSWLYTGDGEVPNSQCISCLDSSLGRVAAGGKLNVRLQGALLEDRDDPLYRDTFAVPAHQLAIEKKIKYKYI